MLWCIDGVCCVLLVCCVCMMFVVILNVLKSDVLLDGGVLCDDCGDVIVLV